MSTPVSCSACQRNIVVCHYRNTVRGFSSSSMCIRTLCRVHVEECRSHDHRSFFLPLVAIASFFFDAAHLNNHAPRQSQEHVLCDMMRAIWTCGEAWRGDMRSCFSEALHE